MTVTRLKTLDELRSEIREKFYGNDSSESEEESEEFEESSESDEESEEINESSESDEENREATSQNQTLNIPSNTLNQQVENSANTEKESLHAE